MAETNGKIEFILTGLAKGIETIEEDVKTLLQSDSSHEERLNSHGVALKWLFGILGSVICGIAIWKLRGL